MIRVRLPEHLRKLAGVEREIELAVEGDVTQAAILDALETCYPMLRGTVRDHQTKKRRPFVRFFACGEDLSLDPTEQALPEPVARGQEPLMVVGAMAGG